MKYHSKVLYVQENRNRKKHMIDNGDTCCLRACNSVLGSKLIIIPPYMRLIISTFVDPVRLDYANEIVYRGFQGPRIGW